MVRRFYAGLSRHRQVDSRWSGSPDAVTDKLPAEEEEEEEEEPSQDGCVWNWDLTLKSDFIQKVWDPEMSLIFRWRRRRRDSCQHQNSRILKIHRMEDSVRGGIPPSNELQMLTKLSAPPPCSAGRQPWCEEAVCRGEGCGGGGPPLKSCEKRIMRWGPDPP